MRFERTDREGTGGATRVEAGCALDDAPGSFRLQERGAA